jgi:hypothetical protein
MPLRTDAETGQQHDWHGMMSKPLGQPFRRIAVTDFANNQSIKANYGFIREADIGL